MIIRLENQNDLEQAAQLISWLNRPHINEVLITLPWLDKNEQHQSAKSLQYLFNDCGCPWAGPAFLVTFAILMTAKSLESGFSWEVLGHSVFFSFGVALVAKFISLGWSFWRLKVWFRTMMLAAETCVLPKNNEEQQ